MLGWVGTDERIAVHSAEISDGDKRKRRLLVVRLKRMVD